MDALGSAASARVSCQHAGRCPGCPYLGLAYAEQLATKQARVTEFCRRYPELSDVLVAAVAPADPVVGYRRRAKCVVAGQRLGLYAAGTHEVVDVCDCRVLDPRLAEVLGAIRSLLPWQPLGAVDLKLVDAGVLVTWVVTDPVDVRKLALLVRTAEERTTRLVEVCPSVCGVALGLREAGAIQLLGHTLRELRGEMHPRCRAGADAPWHYAAHGTFAQAHAGQEQLLQTAIQAALAPVLDQARAPEVLELFAGSGAFALGLAARGARVTAVESFAPAAELASRAAVAQQLDVTVLPADATRIVRDLVAVGKHVDAIVLNPPRRGLAAELRALLPRLDPRLMVYVSCEPATLARDLAALARLGWHARRLQPFDMMPLTAEVESLALLEPGPVPPPRVIHADERLLAVDKPPHEPTIPQGEYATSLLDRVRRLPGAEDAVAVHRLDLETSGVCLFARRPADVPELARALRSGEKVYSGLVRGVVHKKGSISRSLTERGRQVEARTRYVRARVVGGHSLLWVRPDTGRRHQIRRHLGAIGHPLLGDERYGDRASNQYFWLRHGLDRAFLHCERIRLVLDGQTLELLAPLAPDLVSVLEALASLDSEY
jgi:23S rRNA (uracil1939-C5)-methyltransferase